MSESTAESTDRKTVTIKQACEAASVSRRTIYNWLGGGKVEYTRTAGGAVRIFADTLWQRDRDVKRVGVGSRQG